MCSTTRMPYRPPTMEPSQFENSWPRRFLDLARTVAQWSKDPSTKVGAVISDPYNRIISVGFNGAPRRVSDSHERLWDREKKLLCVIHAEENAILFANRSLEGCTLTVWPLPPCAPCAAKIIQVGIARVITKEPLIEHVHRWGRNLTVASEMFVEAGVEVETL